MATSAYHRWDADGRPWKVAKPIKAIGDRLKAHGYTVYYLGDPNHLMGDFPEDHSPYSKTPWPKPHPYPWITAMDIMPPRKGQKSKIDGKPLPSLQALGKQIHKDKQANHPGLRWLKYINWETQRDWGGPCWHDSWQPTYKRRASTDRGHIHASGRTDHVTADTSRGYDPVARLRPKPPAATPQPAGDDDMPLTDKDAPVIRAALHSTQIGKTGVTFAAALDSLRPVPAKLDVILAAVAGDDVAQRVDALADEVRRLAEAEQQRDAQLRELVEQGQDGRLDAAEVVQRIGELLAGQQDTA